MGRKRLLTMAASCPSPYEWVRWDEELEEKRMTRERPQLCSHASLTAR